MVTPRSRHPLILIAAVARNGVIGHAGRLPWRLPGDLARFRDSTMGHPLLMGRITYQSIGGPLPGRATTVLSRMADAPHPGVVVARDIASALSSADAQADDLGAASIMVVGGAAVYAATIGLAQSLLITEVEARPVGDAFFPAIDARVWQRTAETDTPPNPGDDCRYRFVQWARRAGSGLPAP